MLSLAQFVAAYSGKTVGCGPGGSAGDFPTGQCTALACLWTVNLGLGQPCNRCAGSTDNCDGMCWGAVGCGGCAGWTFTAYNGSNQPAPGDIVSWHANQGGALGAGHVDICYDNVSGSGFRGFDQNWGSQTCQLVQHSYAGVIGWQHPGVSVTSPSDPCATVSCPAGYTCSNGTCIPPANPCTGVPCPSGYTCTQGLCVPGNPCASITCPAGYACNELGLCVPGAVTPSGTPPVVSHAGRNAAALIAAGVLVGWAALQIIQHRDDPVAFGAGTLPEATGWWDAMHHSSTAAHRASAGGEVEGFNESKPAVTVARKVTPATATLEADLG